MKVEVLREQKRPDGWVISTRVRTRRHFHTLPVVHTPASSLSLRRGLTHEVWMFMQCDEPKSIRKTRTHETISSLDMDCVRKQHAAERGRLSKQMAFVGPGFVR